MPAAVVDDISPMLVSGATSPLSVTAATSSVAIGAIVSVATLLVWSSSGPARIIVAAISAPKPSTRAATAARATKPRFFMDDLPFGSFLLRGCYLCVDQQSLLVVLGRVMATRVRTLPTDF